MEPTEALASQNTPSTGYANPAVTRETLKFHGRGGEYFGIWIVNLLLTILTLGIYSAWAKVRRLRYFYQHTELAGANFEYHGKPLAILKGRLIALGLLLAYQFSAQFSLKLFALTLLLLVIILPWLLRQSFRFRLHNSSYRGLRFAFKGSNKDAYLTFLLYGFFMFITLYLAAPLFHRQMKLYQHGNSRYGQSPFQFTGSIGQFYAAYGSVIGLTLLVFILAIAVPIGIGATMGGGGKLDPAVAGLLGAGIAGVIILGMLLIAPLWEARTQNLIWNQTTLGEHRFESTLSVWRLMGIQISNMLLVIVTLGLFLPWAQVRLARYRASTLTLVAAGSLDDFLASQQAEESAVGEEAAELFDIDIGL
jgi:uncharacterized membrane protein YjgN (DUF898 family)